MPFFFGRHALFPSAMPFFFQRHVFKMCPFLHVPKSYHADRDAIWVDPDFSHRWIHTFYKVHQCTGRPIRLGVINWLAIISFNSPGVFVYLWTGEETPGSSIVCTGLYRAGFIPSILDPCAFICLILNFKPGSVPNCKIKISNWNLSG